MGRASSFATLMILAAVLSGCRAEKVEIRLKSEDVIAAAAGQNLTARFEAEVGEQFSEVDEEKRSMIDQVMAVIERDFAGVEQDLDIGADGYSIQIEGEMPLAALAPSGGTPWFVQAKAATDGPGVIVTLEPSNTFANFKDALQQINLVIGPDAYQPVEFRFSASSGTVIVGGAMIDGKPVGITRIPMTGQTIKMLFVGGIWEETSGTFVYVP